MGTVTFILKARYCDHAKCGQGAQARHLLALGTSFESAVFEYDSINVSYTRELTSVSMRYSQGGVFNTSLSRLMYGTHE